MDKVIIFNRPDGSLSVIYPTGEVSIEQVLERDIPSDATNVQVVDADTIPSDKTFRNAWKPGAKRILVDLPKAREIHISRIREAREKALAKLDIEWLKATGQKRESDADAIEAKRQVLRDIPQTLDLSEARTADQLKEIWPMELE